MDSIVFPTWQSVGIPLTLLNIISQIKRDDVLEQLVYEKVFHYTRKLQYIYTCGVCGHKHKAEKVTEDYSVCEECFSKGIRATQYLRNWNRLHPSGCSNTDRFSNEVLTKMRQNYCVYFRGYEQDFLPEDIVKFGWKEQFFTAQYLGGEKVEETSTSKALCRAALLVPFLWDSMFDWKIGEKRLGMQQSSIVPIVYEMSNGM